jgi:signal transduction histidine kinase/CheY-like chemotaxis protein
MARIVAVVDSGDPDGDTPGLNGLRAEALDLVVFAMAVVAFLGHLLLVALTQNLDLSRFAYMWLLLGVAGVSHWALRLGPTRAASCLVALLTLALISALFVFHESALVAWFVAITIVAGVLVSWHCAVGVASIATLVTLGGVAAGVLPFEPAAQGLGLTWSGCLLAWLLSHPTRVALDWSWHSYVKSRDVTEALRDRQGELAQVVKSLNHAYQMLEQLNGDLARAREAAERGRHLKAEFAAAISHELRTPLNLIIGFAEMMVMAPRNYGRQTLPAAYREDVEAIYRNAAHLSSLVDDVLDLSQIDAERMGLQREPVRVAAVVDEAIAAMAGLFSGRALSVDLNVPIDLPLVQADSTRVRQVLINLLYNAARFTDRGGIRISARSEGNDVILAVADTGTGIVTEHLATVFDEFRQVHVPSERRVGGSGLGLAVSKRLIELHGGSMWAESQVGVGSTFSFSLPSCQVVVTSPPRSAGETWLPPEDSNGSGGRWVAVIDEDGETARVLSRHLDAFRVVVVREAELEGRLASEPSARAVVVAAPNKDKEAASVRRAMAAAPGLPVVACSLRTSKTIARELGISAYLPKPVTREQIRLVLKRLGKGIRNVLIADDDPEMLQLLTRMVRSFPARYLVREARDGREAMALIQMATPDVVLLDLVMPDLGGDELVRWMRADPAYNDVPAVLLTGQGLGEHAFAAESLTITRQTGLSVAELMRCLRPSLEALHVPPSDSYSRRTLTPLA